MNLRTQLAYVFAWPKIESIIDERYYIGFRFLHRYMKILRSEMAEKRVCIVDFANFQHRRIHTQFRSSFFENQMGISPFDVEKCTRIKHPLFARVPSLARFFNNLIGITCVKERVLEFFSLKLSTLLRDVVQLV